MTTLPKILLVHLYSNGDCLYATAVARQIKTDFPNCHLTWAIASFCKNILTGNPYVDEMLEVNDVVKNDVAAFRQFKRDVTEWKSAGKYDEVFITHNADTNQAYYDGCIRSSVLRAYKRPITVPVKPVLVSSEHEKNNALSFANNQHLQSYQEVILFEYAPLSGQSNMTKMRKMSCFPKG